MKWYNLFRQHILDRGIEYYEDGYVTEFAYSDNRITALVDGSDTYDVEIELDGEDVIDMHCSCPHAADGHNCKHMAAVLFKFEETLAHQDAEMDYDTEEDEEQEDITPVEGLLERIKREFTSYMMLDKKYREEIESLLLQNV